MELFLAGLGLGLLVATGVGVFMQSQIREAQRQARELGKTVEALAQFRPQQEQPRPKRSAHDYWRT